jgi:ethanolamine ammonia-lyase large subunit
MEVELEKIMDDIDKYKLHDLSTDIIKNRKNEILNQILDENELNKYKDILEEYRYVDEVDELRIGSYIRYFVLKNEKGKEELKLMRGGFIVDIIASKGDIMILCRNNNNFWKIKINNCVIFQKNTKQEEVLIKILDHLKD